MELTTEMKRRKKAYITPASRTYTQARKIHLRIANQMRAFNIIIIYMGEKLAIMYEFDVGCENCEEVIIC